MTEHEKTTANKVTVLIPVGWKPCYKKWLPEAIESVLQQTVLPDEIFIVDDQANLTIPHICNLCKEPGYGSDFYNAGHYNKIWFHRDRKYWRDDTRGKIFSRKFGSDNTPKFRLSYWRSPWRLGFSAAFNCGVGLSENDLIIFLAADDKMMPTCIEECLKAWEANKKRDAWYSMAYELSDGTTHNAPNNVAMITKGLWAYLGGFPPSAFAGPDAMMISILMVHAPDKLYRVKNDTPLQWLRQHPDQDTHEQASHFNDQIIAIRNLETKRFTPNPKWAKEAILTAYGINGSEKYKPEEGT